VKVKRAGRNKGRSRLILFNKPYKVLSQFTSKEDKETLVDYITIPDVYPAGRLDYDSEGLLLLTNDGALQHRISDPAHKLPKTYLVQIEGSPDKMSLEKLSSGVMLKDGKTRPADVKIIDEPKGLWERVPPIRFRRNIPTTWLRITITEGKNRQVRRMTAAVGHPVLRLIRERIGPWKLERLRPGEWREEPVKEI